MAGRGRPNREFFFFISDANGMYYYAEYSNLGIPTIRTASFPIPLEFSPANFEAFKIAFGTNKEYFSLVRNVSYTFEMINDGADIMRYFDYQVLGYASEVYLTIIKWDGNILATPARYHLYYKGRFDLKQGKDVIKTGYKVNTLDFSAWGILSQNDNIQYRVQCNASNPKAIRVLYDGITLTSRYVWQPVQIANDINAVPRIVIVPITPVETEGDSVGIIVNSQQFQLSEDMQVVLHDNPDQYFLQTQYARTVTLNGIYPFTVHGNNDGEFGYVWCFYVKSSDPWSLFTEFPTDRILGNFTFPLDDQTHQFAVTINKDIDLADGEKLTLAMFVHVSGIADITFIPLVSNITATIISKASPTAVWCVRPLDVAQDIVYQATGGRYTLNSDFFTLNNKRVVTCGNALRLQSNAYIASTFRDWFKSYDTDYYLALRMILGQIWCEKATTVYSQESNILQLGEVIDIEINQASEYFVNRIDVGSPKQNYEHPSGRLEFNTTNSFSSEEFNVKNILNLISPYRKDSFGQEFIRLDYQQDSTVDNSGDSETFEVDITDELATGITPVQNFVNITVNTAPLAPIIRYPFNNDTITNDKPTVRGVCPPATNVNIYVDGVLDGTALSDADGNWVYDIQTSLTPFEQDISGTILNDGFHLIQATFTDLTAPTEDRSVNIRTGTTPDIIIYPANQDFLYNNKPLLKGFSQAGNSLAVYTDGVFRGNAIADGSCRWFFQLPVLSNGTHTIQAGTATIVVNINSFVDIPLVTSFDDGFPIVNNLPLIEGVATPGTTVYLFANYYPNFPFGSAVADAYGNWSFQTVVVYKEGGVEYLTPLADGANILSTSLDILSTFVSVSGYKLDRPAYTNMNLPDDVFNTRMSPWMSMLARMPLWKSIWHQQPDKIIKFQTGDKKSDFTRTDADGVTIKENNNIRISDYDVPALFMPRIAKFTTKVPYGFNTLLDNFSAGGLVELTYKGNTIWCLPNGDMMVDDVRNNVQKWSLLISAKTPLFTLLSLSKSGKIFTLMTGAIYHSDYNTLHFVKYDYTIPQQYSQPELYDDWFENRSTRWVHNPIFPYRQKFRNADGVIKDQIVVNGVGEVSLSLYRCSDEKLIGTYPYVTVNPQPIPPPDNVREATIDLTGLEHDQYFFVMNVAGFPPAGISERIQIGDWEKSIRIEGTHSVDKTGFFFSTGIKTILRVEGLVAKLQPQQDSIVNKDEVGEAQLLYALSARRRNVFFGDASGLPDYMYLRCALALGLDNLRIENSRYVISRDAKIEPITEYEGYPLYAYKVEVLPYDNNLAALLQGGDNMTGSVVVVVDAEAFGYGGGGLVNIEIKDE